MLSTKWIVSLISISREGFVPVEVKSHSCLSWRSKRLNFVGQLGFFDSGNVDIVAMEKSQQFSYFSVESVRVPLHQS